MRPHKGAFSLPTGQVFVGLCWISHLAGSFYTAYSGSLDSFIFAASGAVS